MLMPEASVNKDYLPAGGKNHIWPSRQIMPM
jgi:hypothetical protein